MAQVEGLSEGIVKVIVGEEGGFLTPGREFDLPGGEKCEVTEDGHLWTARAGFSQRGKRTINLRFYPKGTIFEFPIEDQSSLESL